VNNHTPQEEPVQLSEQTIKNRQSPSPVTKPAVTKSPPILFAAEPLSSCPAAKSSMARIELVLEPESRAILALARARFAAQMIVPDPTKERVAEPAIFRSASAAWTTPQLLVMPILRVNYGNVRQGLKRNALHKPKRLCLGTGICTVENEGLNRTTSYDCPAKSVVWGCRFCRGRGRMHMRCSRDGLLSRGKVDVDIVLSAV
jgi:hypothetical protein